MDSQLPLQRKRKIREDKKPACDTCRAHKLRCDASLDYSRPCTRCHRKQITCVVQEQRRKKACSNHSLKTPSLISQIDPTIRTEHSSNVAVTPLPNSQGFLQTRSASVGDEDGPHVPLVPAFPNGFIDTESRTIDGIRVEANKIDICFSRFFRYFAPLVPILAVLTTPNQTFHESPLKFWVITAIGSRKCLEDPTLFSTLSSHVETLALQSLYLRRLPPYPIVEAYLLMCNFHLSTDLPIWRSIYLTLSSAIVPITLQSGMHQCSSVQGLFTSMANPEVERGAKLWTYAVVLNQITMALQGHLITNASATRHVLWERECCASLPSWLVFECRIIAHVARFHQLVEDLEFSSDLSDYSRSLKSRISASVSELLALQNSVGLDKQGPLSAFYVTLCRLQIQSFMFLTVPLELEHTDVMQLAEAAISTMDLVCDLDKRLQISLACPHPVLQGIQLAACTILKLLKTYPTKIGMLEKDMTNALFSAINIAKSISVRNNDIPGRVAEILGQLWSSPDVYRDSEGSYVLPLRVQNRLAMNVVFDCLYWWRKLFMSPPNEGPHNQHNSDLLTLIHTREGLEESNQMLFDDWETWGFDWDLSGTLHIPTNLNVERGL